MKPYSLAWLCLIVLTFGPPSCQPQGEPPPHILLILADDLGYSDLGCFGGEIPTPHLDRLARQGQQFLQFYVGPTCSPTRAMLWSGIDHHPAGLGTMNGMVTANQAGQPGYETFLRREVITLAQTFQSGGYHTYLSGKWHLGRAKGLLPSQRGFEETFALMQGGGSHFDLRGIVPGAKSDYRRNGRQVRQLGENFYSTAAYLDSLCRMIDLHPADEPFFATLAFTAPHWPLQAPVEIIDRFEPVYQAGWDHLRAARFQRQQALGLFPDTLALPARASDIPAWDSLPRDTQLRYARQMATYAAMVHLMDAAIGRLMTFLQQRGLDSHTWILFCSDNGAAGDDLALEPTYDLDIRDWIRDSLDNRIEAIGQPASFVCYGRKWAQVSNTPFRGFKGTPWEGGIRSPLIVYHPGIGSQPPSHQPLSILDLAPTLLGLAGLPTPATYSGRDLSTRWRGAAAPLSPFQMGGELFNRKSYRSGPWKAVLVPPDTTWSLYHIPSDPTEQSDLARRYPAKKDSLIAAWEAYRRENGIIPGKGSPYYLSE